MSQENVDAVQAIFEAWNRRDFDAAIRDTHEDVELHFVGGFADVMGEEWKGRESLLRFWRDWLGTIGGYLALESALDIGDRVVVIGTMEAVGEASRAPSAIRFGQVWRFHGGKVVRIDGYYDPLAALEAAGLSE
jgi:ketosteroid isomerase-like protein